MICVLNFYWGQLELEQAVQGATVQGNVGQQAAKLGAIQAKQASSRPPCLASPFPHRKLKLSVL